MSLTPSLWSLGDGVKSALSECSLMETQGSVGSTPLEEAVHAAQHLESHFSVLYHNVSTSWAGHQGRKDVAGSLIYP